MTKHQRLLHRLGVSTLVLGLSALSGCMLWMRDPEFYAEELAELLEDEGSTDPIDACYDRYLAEHDPAAKGQLVVEFDVRQKTGALTNIEVVADKTTVPAELASCVTDEIAQLKLDPADARAAHATYTWEFAPGSRKRPPADPFLPAQQAVLACYSAHLSGVDREAQGDLVIDYAFNRDSGAIEQLEVVADATTAPQPVVECAVEILSAAKLDPANIDERIVAGRRSFALRFEPYEEPG